MIEEEKAATREQCIERLKKHALSIAKTCQDDQDANSKGVGERITSVGDFTYDVDQIQRWTVALERKIG